jgi:hypothetical protein
MLESSLLSWGSFFLHWPKVRCFFPWDRTLESKLRWDVTLEPFLFLVAHYVFLIGVGILSYGIGRRLTQKICYDNAMEQFSFCTTLGLGFIAYLIFFVGTLGVLHRELVLFVMGVIFLFCLPVWNEVFQGALSTYRQGRLMKWRTVLFFSLLILFLLPVLLMPLYPPTGFDSTMYHLPYAKIYTQKHGMVLTPYLRFPISPQTNEMLFTFSFLVYDDVSAQMIQFLMMGVVSLALVAFGWRYFSQKAGIWAGVIFLSNPMVLWLGTSAYIDMGLTLFITMGIYSILNWISLKKRNWLILGAIFFGLSVGSKYSALFFLILFSIVILCIGYKTRSLLHPLLFLTIAVGVASPWYFRNWYYTGNPVFPFFGQIFGYGLWSPQDLQGQLNDLLRAHGTGKSFDSLLFLPWNLTFNPSKFSMEAPFSPIYLLGLPILFLNLSISRIRVLFVIVLAYILFWFSTAQILRYLVLIIPLLSLSMAASFDNCLECLTFKRFQWMKRRVVISIVAIIFFIPGWLYISCKVKKEGYPPYTNKQQEIYLTKKLPSFPAYQYLNEMRGQNYSLYALFDENMAYFADGIFMGDWFGPGRFDRIYGRISNPRTLHQELQRLGANYFLIRRDRVKMDMPQEDDFFQSHFKQVYKNDHVLLFEVL